jgi:hypothetical protein
MSAPRRKVGADFGRSSATAIEDARQRQATRVAIEGCRKIIKEGVIPGGTPIGRLGDSEWGWLVAAALFAWISTRAEQAIAEQVNTEQAVRITGLDPEPWDAGVVASILPELAEISDIDWTAPLAQWSRETMVGFLLAATRLIRKAEIAGDLSDTGITRNSSAAVISREANAAGGPLMAPDEFNDAVGDDIPFDLL